MALQTRAIRRRIKSITNTRKITKAMELVSASKMRKAVNAVLNSRTYAKLAWETVGIIAKKVDTSWHPLLRKPEKIKKVLLIFITSDRGLAGGFNVNITRQTMQAVKQLGVGVDVDVLSIGKRGADNMRRAKQKVTASFTEMANNPNFQNILPIGRLVVDSYIKGEYDKVVLAYTDYVSAVRQQPILLDLLPLASQEKTSVLGEIEGKKEETKFTKAGEYKFEPSPRAVLDRLLPRLVETMVYQAVLESAASEHSARMLAMRSASEAAKEMIDSLTFTFNQARQAGITQEIAEISGGRAALEKTK